MKPTPLARARRALACISAIILTGSAASCDRHANTDEVVVYVSADDHIAKPILAEFESVTGIRVRMRGDTEATKNTGLAQKLRAERSRPRADVFWSSEVFLAVQLASEGVLAPYESAAVADWPAPLRDPERRWHGFAQRARVVVYNTERVAAESAPTTLHGLLDPRFKGRIVMARPEFGTTRGHIAAMYTLWGEEEFRAWAQALAANGVRLLDGNSSVVRAVAAGEADVGLTDTDDVWSGQRNGWPVDLVYVRHDLDREAEPVRAGPMVIPNTVALVAGAPHQLAAGRLIDFLLSERVERMLAQSDSHNVPIRPDLAAEFARYAVPDPAPLGYAEVAGAMEPALRICEQALGR